METGQGEREPRTRRYGRPAGRRADCRLGAEPADLRGADRLANARTCRIARVAKVHSHAPIGMIIRCSAILSGIYGQAPEPISRRPDRRLRVYRVSGEARALGAHISPPGAFAVKRACCPDPVTW